MDDGQSAVGGGRACSCGWGSANDEDRRVAIGKDAEFADDLGFSFFFFDWAVGDPFARQPHDSFFFFFIFTFSDGEGSVATFY